jgi:AraC family transcriptional regulator of adaptative response/methylated-DNA-[protein]-cysteine methyltransferase
MRAVSSDAGICSLQFIDAKVSAIPAESFERPSNADSSSNEHLSHLRSQLDEYFAGRRTVFSVALDLRGTVFRKKVWSSLGEIPFGVTISYRTQAARFGNPLAIRAIAAANAANPVMILVPCHRVHGANGNLVGYAGGLARKKWLHEFESRHSEPTLFDQPLNVAGFGD